MVKVTQTEYYTIASDAGTAPESDETTVLQTVLEKLIAWDLDNEVKSKVLEGIVRAPRLLPKRVRDGTGPR